MIPVPVPLDSNSTLLIYGVVPEHYAVVGEALISTLGDALGDAFDAETNRVVRDTLRVCFSRLPVGFRCARRRGSLGYGGVLGAGTRA